MPRLRRCPAPRCPHLTARTYCEQHAREYERKRGSAYKRGYDHAHRKLREHYADRIMRGYRVHCVRCGRVIETANDLDLGHTDDRTRHSGPEHRYCNRKAAGIKAHKQF